VIPEPAPEPPPRRAEPTPVEPPARVERVREEPARVAVVTPPPSRNSERPAARVREPEPERPSRPARAEPAFDPTDPIDEPPVVATGRSAIKADPEPPPAERDPPPPAKRDDDLTALGLFDDDPKGGAGLDTPPPVPVPEPAADPVVLGGGNGGGSAKSAKADTTSVGKGELLDEEGTVNKGAINAKVAVTGGTGPSASTMDRAEVAERLDRIKGNLAQTTVLQKADVDFLSSVDRTDPGYYEANRLLADYYFRLKDYRREAESLDAATTGGRYKHDPMVLLSLAKAYAHTKDYRRALSTMKRVDAKMRNLPAAHKADAYRVHAEMLEFEFLRQFHEDAKRANVSLVDKAIGKWENLQTFSQGADANAAALASKKIRELNELKSRVEL
jgi:tetratricopeptide (TPR) repeat protein